MYDESFAASYRRKDDKCSRFLFSCSLPHYNHVTGMSSLIFTSSIFFFFFYITPWRLGALKNPEVEKKKKETPLMFRCKSSKQDAAVIDLEVISR